MRPYPNLSNSCSVARHGPIGAATSTLSGNADDDDDDGDDDKDEEADDDGGNIECGICCCCCVSAAVSTSITSKTRQLDGTRSRYLMGSETHSFHQV